MDEKSPVQVKHLIEYLSSLPPDQDVWLDKDGWMSTETGLENPTPVQIVARRGLFWKGKDYLIINN